MEPESVDKKAFDSPLPESVFQNSLAVIGLISNRYNEGPEWVMNFRLVRREEGCLAIEWPTETMDCCIYSDSITIGHNTKHYKRTFRVLALDCITNDFLRNFELLWR